MILEVDGKNGKIKESYVYGNGERILTKHYEYAEDGTRMVKEAIGLAYFGARWYNADMGRIICCDPIAMKIEEPVNINKYQYCLNNPLLYIDPAGLFAVRKEKFKGSFIIGGGGGQLKRKSLYNVPLKNEISKYEQELDPEIGKKVEEELVNLQNKIDAKEINDISQIASELERIMRMIGLFSLSLDILKSCGWELQYQFSDRNIGGEILGNNIIVEINASDIAEAFSVLIHEVSEVSFYCFFPLEIEKGFSMTNIASPKGLNIQHFYALHIHALTNQYLNIPNTDTRLFTGIELPIGYGSRENYIAHIDWWVLFKLYYKEDK